MMINTLNDRIDNAVSRISRKEGTIAKKTALIEKKTAKIATLTDEHEIRWMQFEIETLKADIERANDEINETKANIEKYRAQLAGEIEKESIIIKEIPESMKRMQTELVENWDEYDKARRDRLNAKYRELGYKDFMKNHNRADYEFRLLTDEQIHESNMKDAKSLILNLYNRIKDITGEVTDWSGIKATVGTWGMTVLNGLVIGKQGRAEVESIFAGGYNIQRLHVRVLVKER